MFWSGRGTGAMLPRTLAALLLAGVGVWLLLPHASPCNFSRCSGAVATAVKLAEDLSGEENIAFAFCDHAVDNYDGFRLLAQEMPTAATVDEWKKANLLWRIPAVHRTMYWICPGWSGWNGRWPILQNRKQIRRRTEL